MQLLVFEPIVYTLVILMNQLFSESVREFIIPHCNIHVGPMVKHRNSHNR